MALGLSDEEFGALTPRQYHLLLDRHAEQMEHSKMLAGLIAATIVNWSGHGPETTVMPGDFFSAKKDQARHHPNTERTRAVLMTMVNK